MLRTNSKQAKEAIRKYLQDGFNNSCYNLDENIYDGMTLPDIAKKFIEILKDEWYKGYNKRNYTNIQSAVIEYLKTLPSSITIDFYYTRERELLKQWLQETEEESKKYDDEKVDSLYWHLLSREIVALSRMK